MLISDWSSDVCSSDLGRFSLRRAHVMRKAAANRPSAPVDVLTRTEMVNCLFSKPARNSGPTEQVAGTSLSSTPQIRVQPRSHPAVPAVRMSSKESRSEEHTSELKSLMRISYAVFCLKKNK